MEFKISKNPHDDHVDLYSNDTLVLEPGITVLVGCNGSGKSTLLRIIRDKCEEMDLKCMMYNNLSDGGTNSIGEKMLKGLTSEAAMRMIQSEGENIHSNMGDFAAKISRELQKIINNFKSNSEVFILLDSVDSGLDIANIDEINEVFRDIIIPDFKAYGLELYVIISTNSYEFCIDNNCIDIGSLKPKKIDSYENFRAAILASNKKKNIRYENINKHIRDERKLDFEREK